MNRHQCLSWVSSFLRNFLDTMLEKAGNKGKAVSEIRTGGNISPVVWCGCGVLEGACKGFVPLSGPLLVSTPSHSLPQRRNEVAGSLRHSPLLNAWLP